MTLLNRVNTAFGKIATGRHSKKDRIRQGKALMQLARGEDLKSMGVTVAFPEDVIAGLKRGDSHAIEKAIRIFNDAGIHSVPFARYAKSLQTQETMPETAEPSRERRMQNESAETTSTETPVPAQNQDQYAQPGQAEQEAQAVTTENNESPVDDGQAIPSQNAPRPAGEAIGEEGNQVPSQAETTPRNEAQGESTQEANPSGEQLKEQAKEQPTNGGGGKSAQNTAKAANEDGGQEKKAPTSNQDSKKTVGGGENAVTIEENIANGQLALEKIMKNHGEVKEAMERPEIGAIDFLWGQEGTDERKHKDGFGISKILLKHGAEAVNMIPEVIAKGRFEKSPNGDRVYFVLNGYRAVVRLTWDGKKKTWLVTNFLDKKIKNPDDTDAFVRSVSTADGTISPSEQDSSVDSSIPQQKTKRNEKIGSFSVGKTGKKFTATLDESLGGEYAKDHAEAIDTLAESFGGKGKDGTYIFGTKRERDGFLECANAYIALQKSQGNLDASASAEAKRIREIVRGVNDSRLTLSV